MFLLPSMSHKERPKDSIFSKYLTLSGQMPNVSEFTLNSVPIEKSDLVLLVDAGEGEILQSLARKVADGLLDVVEENKIAYNSLARLLKKERWKHVNVRKLSVNDIKKYSGNEFDLILWLGINRHNNPIGVLKEFRKLLTHNGKLGIMYYEADKIAKLNSLAKKHFDKKIIHSFKPAEIKTLCENAKFSFLKNNSEGILSISIFS